MTVAPKPVAWPVQGVQLALVGWNCLGFGGLEWAVGVQIL